MGFDVLKCGSVYISLIFKFGWVATVVSLLWLAWCIYVQENINQAIRLVNHISKRYLDLKRSIWYGWLDRIQKLAEGGALGVDVETPSGTPSPCV